jgi:hypothetical protein
VCRTSFVRHSTALKPYLKRSRTLWHFFVVSLMLAPTASARALTTTLTTPALWAKGIWQLELAACTMAMCCFLFSECRTPQGVRTLARWILVQGHCEGREILARPTNVLHGTVRERLH